MKLKISHRSKWWMGHVRSVDVGERLRLVPYWDYIQAPSDRIAVRIDPGPSFGAGDHPTTLMALGLLEQAVVLALEQTPRPTMLDVGTGTGVLAIAAMRLGTERVLGLDIDPAAIFAARRNFQINGLHLAPNNANAASLAVGSVDCAKGPFDIVAANLVAPLLLRLSDRIIETSRGVVVLSGIAEPMADKVMARFASGDLMMIRRENKEGWHAGLFRKRLRAESSYAVQPGAGSNGIDDGGA